MAEAVRSRSGAESGAWGLVGLALALLLHLIAGAALYAYTEYKKRHPDPIRENIPIEVAVVPKAAPPPPPEVKKAEPPKPVPMKKIARVVRPKVKIQAPPPPRDAPPPPPDTAPPPPTKEAVGPPSKEPIKVLSGITMESTTSSGNMAVGVGNTLYGTPNRVAPEPAQVKPYKAERYAPAAQVNELPEFSSRPDLRRFYPEEARRAEFEGDVVLRVLVDSDGSVAKAELISDPGKGLGQAGLAAIREFRFSPGKVNGTPVATTVPITLHFILN